MKRQIIHIDQEKCNGCGACAAACHEGAIAMIGGKATLMRDDYCDGMGDCLPHCPTGAITFEQREAAPYNGGRRAGRQAAQGRPNVRLPRQCAQDDARLPGQHGQGPAPPTRQGESAPDDGPQPAAPVAGADQAGACERTLL